MQSKVLSVTIKQVSNQIQKDIQRRSINYCVPQKLLVNNNNNNNNNNSNKMENKLVVLSKIDVNKIQYEDDEKTKPILDDDDKIMDNMDTFNHPRIRRLLILTELQKKITSITNDGSNNCSVEFQQITTPASIVVDSSKIVQLLNDVYGNVHTNGLIEFLATSWDRWVALGEKGRSPTAFLHDNHTASTNAGEQAITNNRIPPMLPICSPLRSDTDVEYQCPSLNVIGQNCFYNTDTFTPIFDGFVNELVNDALLVQSAVEQIISGKVSTCYVLTSHPGHHSSYNNFGGYCYLNHAAACADLLRSYYNKKLDSFSSTPSIAARIAILDVDYHCGNGTASIYYTDPSVLVISIHCHPDYEYPFHSGFDTQIGTGPGLDATMHIPLSPGTTWKEQYKQALSAAMTKINSHNPVALIVSLGLDTYDSDPCALAGFSLHDNDYNEMGYMISTELKSNTTIPTIFIQEGGYRMDKVGQAAADVVLSFVQYR